MTNLRLREVNAARLARWHITKTQILVNGKSACLPSQQMSINYTHISFYDYSSTVYRNIMITGRTPFHLKRCVGCRRTLGLLSDLDAINRRHALAYTRRRTKTWTYMESSSSLFDSISHCQWIGSFLLRINHGRSQRVARVAKAAPIPSKKNYKARTIYSIDNIHIAH